MVYIPKYTEKFGKYGEDCTHENKINFEGFTENGCYGNQPQPFEVVIVNIEAHSFFFFLQNKI